MACVICRSEGRTDLCGVCRRALARCRLAKPVELQSLGRPLPLYALYHYQDAARLLLHEAKIGCVWRAVLAMERCFMVDPVIRECVAWADLIVAAPSSLWGRLRGRYDPAGYIGASLAKAWQKTFLQPRGPRFWRWRKRAFASRPERQVRLRFRRSKRPSFAHLPGQSILLVDDVVTSGFTMAELSEHFPGKSLRLVAFAQA